MGLKFHRGGKLRTWLGARLGGGVELGDRVWRRCLHVAGAGVLVYFLLPYRIFFALTKLELLLAALAAVLLLEILRHLAGAELPTIRSYEHGRVASFAFYAVALVVAVLLFPEPIAIVVVLGTSIVDPLIGELRVRKLRAPTYPFGPWVAYVGLGVAGLWIATGAGIAPILVTAAVAAAIAVAVESPRVPWLDDDLAMTLVPGLAVWIGAIVAGPTAAFLLG
ncbi:MAG TPA: hypothetical protein VFF67_07660 [Thermoplasmata archaeon]|nr:hypothetical protein [Thermoplasmata archaeon]